MASEIIINKTSHETRAALLENGSLAELYIERESDKGIAGNLYKGKIQRVLPGMQAAFVDIGISRSAFLCADDVYQSTAEFESMLNVLKEKDDKEEMELPLDDAPDYPEPAPTPPIEDMITEGREILVQVMKEPIGSKGARVSCHISLPGRYLVYLPTLQNIGISRRISDPDERERLRDMINAIKPDSGGFIIRTASENAAEEELAQDMDFLIKLWDNIQSRTEQAPVMSLLHEDLDMALRVIRDLYSRDVTRVVVDSEQTHQKIIGFIETFMPQLTYSVELYEGVKPVFDYYGIEVEISRALEKNIWLKSGGYIVIEETEALVVIDVNTGRYVGKGNQADTILKTNLEAIKEIAYQLRLRNLGGIIIIDFIDMEKKSDRELVLHTLQETLKKDRAKTVVIDMSELGLVQMTRKRVRENLGGHMCTPCPYCEGKGSIRSVPSLAYDILRRIRKEAVTASEEKIFVLANPDIVSFLYHEERFALDKIEKQFNKKITIKADSKAHHEDYNIFAG